MEENGTLISWNSGLILFQNAVNEASANLNIYKYKKFWKSMMLILDTRSNMTSKYGIVLSIIIRLTNEKTEIDTARHDASRLARRTLSLHLHVPMYTLPRPTCIGWTCCVTSVAAVCIHQELLQKLSPMLQNLQVLQFYSCCMCYSGCGCLV